MCWSSASRRCGSSSVPSSTPTSLKKRSKKRTWRASSAIWVQRKIRCISVGQARMIGPSSSATFCSPMKKLESPYMRWKRSSSGIRSCQSTRSWEKSRSWVSHCCFSQRL